MRDYLTIPEVAERLDVSAITVRRYIKGGELEAVLIGGVFRIYPENVEEFIESRRYPRRGRPPKREAVSVA